MEAIAERAKWATFNPASDKTLEEVLLSSQHYMIFQLAHCGTAIKSSDGNPWIRCIGFTQTLDAARELARRAHDFQEGFGQGGTETRIMPCGKNFLAGAVKYNGLDLPRRQEEQSKSNDMITTYLQQWQLQTQAMLKVNAEAEKGAQSKSEGQEEKKDVENLGQDLQVAKSPLSNVLREVEKPEITILEKGQPPSTTTRVVPNLTGLIAVSKHSIVVPLQRVFAIGVVQDPDDGTREPSVIPLFAMDTEAELAKQIEIAKTCKDLMPFDVFVGVCGEWLPLYRPKAASVQHQHPLRNEFYKNIRIVPPSELADEGQGQSSAAGGSVDDAH